MVLLQISNIKLNISEPTENAYHMAMKISGIKKDEVLSKKIIKHSIDARNKDNILNVYNIGLYVEKYDKKRKNVKVISKEKQYIPPCEGKKVLHRPPVVVGFGPAGMFAAYLLSLYGYNPIILERGDKVRKRDIEVSQFWNTGRLNTESNVQFGEGGAGTFSDGKLNTGIKDKENRIKFVLETFVKFGAASNILYESKPHIGTDVLKTVVENIREEIIKLGGRFCFNTRLDKINYSDNKLTSVSLSNGQKIDTDICILAIGHSGRDTFKMLYDSGVCMEQKPFAIGVRVEHKQSDINMSQYGFCDNRLGAAPYKLTYTSSSGRGVYSFCMCPGGFVVDSSSEEKMKVVNGMSYSRRDGDNANSAIVVTVLPKDFNNSHPLSGMAFQRNLEKRAFLEGKGAVPVQKYIDYKENRTSKTLGEITPNIKGRYNLSNINNIFPEYINQALKEAMEYFGNKINGFDSDDVILSAVESRTSSPVRIIRDENYQSNIEGLMPAGEGAGYAGGITSAAIDGMKIFEFIRSHYKSLN